MKQSCATVILLLFGSLLSASRAFVVTCAPGRSRSLDKCDNANGSSSSSTACFMTATIRPKEEQDEQKTSGVAPPSKDDSSVGFDLQRRETLVGTAAVLSIPLLKELELFGGFSLGNSVASTTTLTTEALVGDTIVRNLWLNRLAYPVLIVALEIGLFEALKNGPLRMADLGAKTTPALKGTGRALEAMVGVLTSLELLTCKTHSSVNNNKMIELTPAARQVLLQDSPFFWGPQLLAADGLTSVLRNAVRRDDKDRKAADYAGGHSVAAVNSFIDSMQAHGSVTAAATATALQPILGPSGDQPAHHVLDMAGGSGCFARALLQVVPMVTLADIPSVVARFRSQPHNKVKGLFAVPADLFVGETWPVGPDVHLMANVVHDWGYAQSIEILRNSHRALVDASITNNNKKNGRCILVEQLLHDDQSGPLPASLASVSMLLGDWRTGKQYSFAELKRMMLEAGFSSVKLGPSCGNFHKAVIGHI